MHCSGVLALALLWSGIGVAAAGLEPKVGGVGFRFDDNQTAAKWHELGGVFEKHGLPMMMSINFGNRELDDPAFVTELKRCLAAGHEVMDHTPLHRVFSHRFADEAAAGNWAAAHPDAADHCDGRWVRFSYRVKPEYAAGRFKLAVDGKKIHGSPDLYRLLARENLLYSPQLKKAFSSVKNADGSYELRSFWEENNVDLGKVPESEWLVMKRFWGFAVHPDALRLLAATTRSRAQAAGLPLPTTWIQPGGREAIILAGEVDEVYGKEFGYTAGATYQDAAFKVFNEPEPRRARFAMQWGNFNLEREEVAAVKKRLADLVAKNYVLFGSSHLDVRKVPGAWPAYLKRHDELLQWCREQGIPVRTQRDWAERLYGRKPDPAWNIMPQFSLDRDGDGVPDGYRISPGVQVLGDALQVPARTMPIWSIERLSGMEKGDNEFSIECVAPVGTELLLEAVCFGRKGKISEAAVPLRVTRNGGERLTASLRVPPDAVAMTLALQGRQVSAPITLRGPKLIGR